jgi:hypothetical protein
MQGKDMTIDIVVPFHSKDGDTINWYIQDIKNPLDVRRIFVVCNQERRPFVESSGVIFFIESKVVEG